MIVSQTITPHDPEQVAELDEAARREPIHQRDRIPQWMLRLQGWMHARTSNRTRLVMAVLVIVLVLFAVLRLSGMTLLGIALGFIDPFLLLAGVFLVNWLGNGGVLIPIPGARFIGLLLIFQNAVLVPSWEVWVVSGSAMALGLLSYYIAGARTAQSYAAGDAAGAEELAARTGMLDDEVDDFSPGAELDAGVTTAMAGTSADTQAAERATSASRSNETQVGRLRYRLSTSLQRAQERARPVIEQRGTNGMVLLCFAPSPMGTAAAYLGGLMRFGFGRYLLASFVAKFLLAGIIVVLALLFNDVARSVAVPELTIPIIDLTLFESTEASPLPSALPAP